MAKNIERIVEQMRTAPHNVRYNDLKSVCEHEFGPPRQSASSHCVFKKPWQGDPRVNIQPGKDGRAKAYQVRQVLAAIDRLRSEIKDE
jgi:hypothetical protein